MRDQLFQLMMNQTSLSTRNGLRGFTPVEARMGRYMRAEDGHAGASGGEAGGGAGAGGDNGAAAAAAAAAAGGGGDDQVTSLAGGADKAGGEAKPGDDGAGKADGEGGGDAVDPEKAKADAAALLIGAPEKYEVKAPEGMQFDEAMFAAVEPELRAMNLSNDAAQKLTELYASKVLPSLVERAREEGAKGQLDQAAKIRSDWAAEAKADPEIGGAKFDQTVDRAADVWQHFGIAKGTGFRQLLDETGLGNHPEMLRFLSRVGTAVGEGSFNGPGGAGSGERKTDKEIFYGQ